MMTTEIKKISVKFTCIANKHFFTLYLKGQVKKVLTPLSECTKEPPQGAITQIQRLTLQPSALSPWKL